MSYQPTVLIVYPSAFHFIFAAARTSQYRHPPTPHTTMWKRRTFSTLHCRHFWLALHTNYKGLFSAMLEALGIETVTFGVPL